MPIKLLLHTLSTSTPVAGDCCVYWQNAPKLTSPASKTKLIDATPLTLESIWKLLASYGSVTLVGIDLLLPLKLATAHQVLAFIRALADQKDVAVILNSDDALRAAQGEQEVLLRSLAHSSETVTALRPLPSGRDREFAGMARFTRGYRCQNASGFREGERLYKYQEDMMSATL